MGIIEFKSVMSKKSLGIITVIVILLVVGLIWAWRAGTFNLSSNDGKDAQNGEEESNSKNPSPAPAPASGSSGAATKKIRVISPNGSEVWQRGKQYLVKWDTATIPPDADIFVNLMRTNSVITDPYKSNATGREMFNSSAFPSGLPPEGNADELNISLPVALDLYGSVITEFVRIKFTKISASGGIVAVSHFTRYCLPLCQTSLPFGDITRIFLVAAPEEPLAGAGAGDGFLEFDSSSPFCASFPSFELKLNVPARHAQIRPTTSRITITVIIPKLFLLITLLNSIIPII